MTIESKLDVLIKAIIKEGYDIKEVIGRRFCYRTQGPIDAVIEYKLTKGKDE